MIDNLNKLIDINLKIISESDKNSDFQLTHFVNINGKRLDSKNESEKFGELMEREGLIKVNGEFCSLEKLGLQAYNYGGWTKFLTDQENRENEIELKQREKENLELKLAKSNLEANKVNKKNAKSNEKNERKNRITTWINIIMGILNIGLLLLQILKT
ncbi:hypothetical protein [Flavobacterium sp.]|uniref:hypothetical protein n=1 Tax=Flavobacterium sp. TaxID=239 RepID=UPI0040489BCA